jgi:hypothetical protein
MSGLSPQHDGSELDEASKRKRLAITSGQKACNPCRNRKVRCSFELPCKTCQERNHPELCQYDVPQKRVRLEGPPPSTVSSPPATWMPGREDWDALLGKIAHLEQGIRDLRHQMATSGRQPDTSPPASTAAVDGTARGMHTTNPLNGETVFVGANSVPAMAAALGDSDIARTLGARPMFTLENDSATYPFIDLWGLPHASPERIEKLCALLPQDADCLQYVRHYRDTAHVLFPAIVDMQQFEGQVTGFLMARMAMSTDPDMPRPTERDVYGRNVHWLGLLFACLASGCQCSNNLQPMERQVTSQIYSRQCCPVLLVVVS